MQSFTASYSLPPGEVKSFWYSTRIIAVSYGLNAKLGASSSDMSKQVDKPCLCVRNDGDVRLVIVEALV